MRRWQEEGDGVWWRSEESDERVGVIKDRVDGGVQSLDQKNHVIILLVLFD